MAAAATQPAPTRALFAAHGLGAHIAAGPLPAPRHERDVRPTDASIEARRSWVGEAARSLCRRGGAWARSAPQEGQFDREALDHYSRVIDTGLEAGVTPMLTRPHFTHPLWFEQKGSFEHKLQEMHERDAERERETHKKRHSI